MSAARGGPPPPADHPLGRPTTAPSTTRSEFKAALPPGAKFELRRIDAPSLLPTLCSTPRTPGDVDVLMAEVNALRDETSYDFGASASMSNAARTMPTWYLIDYLERFAAREIGDLEIWTIMDTLDASGMYTDTSAAEYASRVSDFLSARGPSRATWNVVGEVEQVGTQIGDPGCYADPTNLMPLVDATGGRFVRFCRDWQWAEAIVDSAWHHYLQPVAVSLPTGLAASGWRLVVGSEGHDVACAVDALPEDRAAPACLPFVRDGDTLMFRAADLMSVSWLKIEPIPRELL